MGNGRSWIWGSGFQGVLFGNRYAVLVGFGVGTPKWVFGEVQNRVPFVVPFRPRGWTPLRGSQAQIGVWGDPGLDPCWGPTWDQMCMRSAVWLASMFLISVKKPFLSSGRDVDKRFGRFGNMKSEANRLTRAREGIYIERSVCALCWGPRGEARQGSERVDGPSDPVLAISGVKTDLKLTQK